MAIEEFNMEVELSPRDAAYALGVTVRTLNNWFNEERIGFVKDFKEHKRVRISDLYDYAERIGIVDQPAFNRMRERLRNDIIPKYEEGGAKVTGSHVPVTV